VTETVSFLFGLAPRQPDSAVPEPAERSGQSVPGPLARGSAGIEGQIIDHDELFFSSPVFFFRLLPRRLRYAVQACSLRRQRGALCADRIRVPSYLWDRPSWGLAETQIGCSSLSLRLRRSGEPSTAPTHPTAFSHVGHSQGFRDSTEGAADHRRQGEGPRYARSVCVWGCDVSSSTLCLSCVSLTRFDICSCCFRSWRVHTAVHIRWGLVGDRVV
jgi:hypothetical protein